MDIVFEDAWRQGDATQARQAKLFWGRLNFALVEERNRWVSELCCMAYDGDRLAGVSTATLRVLPQWPARLAMYRCAVAPEFRRRELAKRLTARSMTVMESWPFDQPEERLNGLAVIVKTRDPEAKTRHPVWSEHNAHLNLAGSTPNGGQVRVAWFRHA